MPRVHRRIVHLLWPVAKSQSFRPSQGKKKSVSLPWCYYCDREFADDKILINHQKAKVNPDLPKPGRCFHRPVYCVCHLRLCERMQQRMSGAGGGQLLV